MTISSNGAWLWLRMSASKPTWAGFAASSARPPRSTTPPRAMACCKETGWVCDASSLEPAAPAAALDGGAYAAAGLGSQGQLRRARRPGPAHGRVITRAAHSAVRRVANCTRRCGRLGAGSIRFLSLY
jgi:hypothetical protein